MFTYKSQKLRLILLVLFIGIFFGKTLFFPSYILFVGILFLLISILYKKYIFLLISLLLLGNFHGQYRNIFDLKSDILPQYYNETVQLNAWVESFPDIRQKNNRVFIQVTEIQKNNQKKSGKNLGKLLLIYPSNMNLDYGENIKIFGKIQKPKNFDEFDYQDYLKRFGIQSILKNSKKIEILPQENSGNFFIFRAKKIRNVLSENLEKSLPSPHDQIAMGILLGVKKELPIQISQNFKNSGLQHILVVSGFNVTVLLLFVALLFKRFGQYVVFLGSSLSLFFFTFMVGADPPVLRAAIFGIIVSWAVFSGKFSDSRNLLFLTATILAVFSPQMVQTDIGFFLSFFATFGIIIGVPICQNYFKFITKKFELRTIISVIISAQISVFPILSLSFGHFPFIGLFSNIFIEPLIPLGMFFSFMTAVLAPVVGNIIVVFAIPAEIILGIILFFADLFGKVDPIFIPKIVGQISIIFLLCFLLWGSFSRRYQQKFIEKLL